MLKGGPTQHKWQRHVHTGLLSRWQPTNKQRLHGWQRRAHTGLLSRSQQTDKQQLHE
jgi:hypothetical protein